MKRGGIDGFDSLRWPLLPFAVGAWLERDKTVVGRGHIQYSDRIHERHNRLKSGDTFGVMVKVDGLYKGLNNGNNGGMGHS